MSHLDRASLLASAASHSSLWLLVVALATLSGCGDDAESVSGPDAAVAVDTAVSDAQLADVANGDAISADSTSPDTSGGEDVPHVWPEPIDCKTNDDCVSGFCLPTPDGKKCAIPCVDKCPAEFTCKEVVAASDVVFICAHKASYRCQPCAKDSDCDVSGKPGGVCRDLGGGGFCLQACETDANCVGSEFSCKAADASKPIEKQCVPNSGLCPCPDGKTGLCSLSNTHGACPGTFTCVGGKPGPCQGTAPQAEVCNGADDNCDGQLDEGVPSADCDLTNVYGTCIGKTLCVGGKTLCEGAKAASEVCNGIDDNCSGKTDEGFVNTDQSLPNGDDKADCIDTDDDADGIEDGKDVCPLAADPSQTDTDKDGKGDACDDDDDDDGTVDSKDGCPLYADKVQEDTDKDGKGDSCDCDIDGDGVPNLPPAGALDCPTPATPDVCPLVANANQLDTDGDGKGDVCDDDDDGDGVPDAKDVCPLVADVTQVDSDGDGAGNACDDDDDNDGVADGKDVCPLVVNKDQTDTDNDGKGDACDPDLDGDGVDNDKDNCKGKANPAQTDANNNGIGDACENDWDGDGIDNASDNCDWVVNKTQADMDKDGVGDACDCDIDGDGVGNTSAKVAGCPAPTATDNCTTVFNKDQADLDKDGTGDACDSDIDGDGDNNTVDCAPKDQAISSKGVESCNGKDDDCDGKTDEVDAQGCSIWYFDGDGDGTGVSDKQCLCAATTPYVAKQSGDCNDKVAEINPAAPEICGNGKDDNCNGSENDEDAKGCTAWYFDGDGDGWGTATKKCLCTASGEFSAKKTGDCDDKVQAISPAQPEKCKDGLDNDCDGDTDEAGCSGCTTFYKDGDGDGFGSKETQCLSKAAGAFTSLKPGDCDDGDKTVNPSGKESCNFKDDNCDGQTDELGADGCKSFWYDGDSDGFGAGAAACLCKAQGNQKATKDGDCDDKDATANPLATEICGNGKDDNCKLGEADKGATGCTKYFLDADGDGYGTTQSECLCAPSGQYTAKKAGDCKDTDAAMSPVLVEKCQDDKDNDCDGKTDEEGCQGCIVFFKDVDGDGFGLTTDKKCLSKAVKPYAALEGGDCVDSDGKIGPKAQETCNGKDDDCDGKTDEDDAVGCSKRWSDGDGDGYGTGAVRCLCKVAKPWTATKDGDCNDKSATVNPGQKEICGNGKDDNCNGSENDKDATGCVKFYADSDGDGYGVGAAHCACSPSGAFSAKKVGDCDDKASGINPGQVEVCKDNKDNNCNKEIDEAGCQGCATYYLDKDGDGYGVATSKQCLGTAKYPYTAFVAGDCDDDSANIKPGALETCNGKDDNCDKLVDPIGTLGCKNFYPDQDKDGWGANVSPTCACKATGVYVVNKTGDCNDANKLAAPGLKEICDGQDNNCNNQVDEFVQTAWYKDNDGDGFGSGAPVMACKAPSKEWVQKAGDCNDFNKAIFPQAKETCNEIDDDCDSLIDEGLATTKIYKDNDGDGWAPSGALSQTKCNVPVGWTKARDFDGDGKSDWDCGDSDTTVHPGAADVCGDGKDNDCNGSADKLCFNKCGGAWPFKLKYSGGNIAATPVDLDGDGTWETVVQDSFGFAVLGGNGAPLYTYSAPQYNYSRSQVVFADVDTYNSFGAGAQGLEILGGNGSVANMYKLNVDGTMTKYDAVGAGVGVYDASRFMSFDINGDGAPELIASTWCEPDGVKVFRFDTSKKELKKVASIKDPNGVCEYWGGRSLVDLDADGLPELVHGNGYPQGDAPQLWAGKIYAWKLTDLAKFTFSAWCQTPGTCAFATAISGLYGVYVGDFLVMGDKILAQVGYSTTNVKGQPNGISTKWWEFDLKGKGAVKTSGLMTSPTDVDDDGTVENIGTVRHIGLWDVNGDGYPDQLYSSGNSLRVNLWDAKKKTFVYHPASTHALAASTVTLRGVADLDGDGQLDVLATDAAGTVYCRELGKGTFNRYTSLPPHVHPTMRTWNWDNYEPNDGQDINKDGMPDRFVRIPSALTRKGAFYSYLTSASDVDVFQLDTSWGGSICLRAPKGRKYTLTVYSYADRWNNTTKKTPGDGKADGQLWSGTTSAGGTTCFYGSAVYPYRYGEYRFLAKITSASGSSPYWPYWLTAAK